MKEKIATKAKKSLKKLVQRRVFGFRKHSSRMPIVSYLKMRFYQRFMIHEYYIIQMLLNSKFHPFSYSYVDDKSIILKSMPGLYAEIYLLIRLLRHVFK